MRFRRRQAEPVDPPHPCTCEHGPTRWGQGDVIAQTCFDCGGSVDGPIRLAAVLPPVTPLEYVRRGPTEAEWGKAIDESWAWFEKNLGRTPCSYDVQMWIDGYVPKT